jgi:A/G-specific adenine glycosylase
MLQQTRVETVAPYYERFLARWPDFRALAAAPLEGVLSAWAGLGYYARARNLHACARKVVEEHGGRLPESEPALRHLPGIGAYTAAAIAAIAFDQRALPIDGNVERVAARIFAFKRPLPKAKAELHRLTRGLAAAGRPGDFAQALMDLGATICTPRNPACGECPWEDACAARALGAPERFPRIARKPTGPLRRGIAFVALRDDGAMLLRTRPAKGLLGGMVEVPSSEWRRDFAVRRARRQAPKLGVKWQRLSGAVRHVFTHFPLELDVYATRVPKRRRAPAGMRFVPRARLEHEPLPKLMRKVIDHALAALSQDERQGRKQ